MRTGIKDQDSYRITTFTGREIDYLDPKLDAISIVDIAHGLSKTCRYSGQSPLFYSVAQHSVWVSRNVPPEHALEGLLHDATEAYMCDIPTPLKRLLPDYQRLEANLDEVIRRRFGLPASPTLVVGYTDKLAYKVEVQDIWRPNEPTGYNRERILPVRWELALMEFLNVYVEITGETKL